MNLSVEICGCKFKNPVIAASGTFGFGHEFAEWMDISRLGGIALKGLTPLPRQGNPPPRVAETAMGMLNSVGLQNPGLEGFLAQETPYLQGLDTVRIANIAGNTIEDYCTMAQGLRDAPIDMLELNISCPNVKEGGVAFGVDPRMVYEVTKQVLPHCVQPLMVKLSPNAGDIVATALAAQEAGAHALSLINTLTGMAIDVHTRKPILANITGGLSGPAVMPVALRMVWQVAHAVAIPVVGIGGIMTGEDAVAFLLAGAQAVQVGTANIIKPTACIDIMQGIEAYMCKHNITDVNELVGALIS